MKLRQILGVIVSFAALACAMILSGGTIRIVDALVALAFMAVAPLGVGVAGVGASALSRAFGAAGSGDAGAESAPELRAAKAVFKLLIAATIAAAAMGFLCVFIIMLKNLESKATIGLWFSYCVIPALIGLMNIACLFMPLMHAVSQKLTRASFTRDAGEGEADGGGERPMPRLALGAMMILAAGGLAIVLYRRGGFFTFIDAASLIIILFIPLGNILTGPGLGGLAKAIKAISPRGAGRSTIGSLRYARATFSFMTRSFLASGGIAILAGAVMLLMEFGDKSRVGPSVALVFISLTYATLAMLCLSLPLAAAAERKLALMGDDAIDGHASQ